MADVVEVAGGERRHLADEQEHVRSGHGGEGADGGIGLAPGRRPDHEAGGGEQGQAEGEQHERAAVPGGLLQGSVRGGGLRGEHRVRAEGSVPARTRREALHDSRAEPGENEQGEHRGEPPGRRTRAAEPGVQAHPDEQGGEQDQPLQPHAGGGRDREEEHALTQRRRLLECPRRREERGGDERYEERLGHQQPAVPVRGREQAQHGGGEAPPRTRQRAAPEEDRDGDEGHRERLQSLGGANAGTDVVERQRQPDQRGREQAVVGGGGPAHRQLAGLPQRLAEQPVHHLVGRDPRHREAGGEPEAHAGGQEHDRPHGDDGVSRAARHGSIVHPAREGFVRAPSLARWPREHGSKRARPSGRVAMLAEDL